MKYRILVVGFLLFTMPVLAHAQSTADPGDEVHSRSIRVFGCEITPDVNAVKRCLEDKIDDMIKDATRPLKGQIDDLRGAIDNLGRTPIMGCRITPDVRQTTDCLNDRVGKEIAKETAKAQARVALDLKQLERQRDNLQQQLAELQKNAGAAAGKFQRDLQALGVLDQLNLGPLHACLAAAQANQRDVLQLTQRFVSDPPGFPPFLITEVWQKMEASFDIIMDEEMAALRASAARGMLPQADIVLDRSVRAMKKLADRDPSARCLYAFIEPHVPAMKRSAKDVQQQVNQKVIGLVERKVLPVLFEPVGQAMGGVFDQLLRSEGIGGDLTRLLPNQKELDRIIRGVAAEQLIRPNQVKDAASKLHALSTALGNRQNAQTALLTLQRALDRQQIWPEEVAIQVGIEILRFSGHKYVDSDLPGNGAFFANIGVSILSSAKDTVGNVVESACGLIPEAGAAACSIYKELIEFAYDYISPETMKILISNAMHGELDRLMDRIGKAYIERHDPRQVRQELGAFAAMVDRFPTREVVIAFATRDRQVRAMQLALFEYHDSVRQFAETAVRR
jgi:hypothetical protein